MDTGESEERRVGQELDQPLNVCHTVTTTKLSALRGQTVMFVTTPKLESLSYFFCVVSYNRVLQIV